MRSQLILSSVLMTTVIVSATNAQVQDATAIGENPSPSESQGPPDNQALPCAGVVIDLAPSHTPRSLKDLYEWSDVIVEGVVATVFPSRELGSAQSLETDALIDVTTVLKGSATVRQVVISQTGGRRGRFCTAPTQFTLVRPGEKYILFLREDDRPNMPEPAPVNRYLVTGTWSGLFYFQDDRMRVRVHNSDSLRAQYEGQTLEQIKSDLQGLSGLLVVP